MDVLACSAPPRATRRRARSVCALPAGGGLLLALTVLTSSSPAQSGRSDDRTIANDYPLDTRADHTKIQLFNELGAQQYAISTNSPLAQRFFDQGMRLAWVFEFDAARRSFAEAERLDPRCAMCAWGVAWTLTALDAVDLPNATLTLAREALARAHSRTRRVTPRELGQISALAIRLADSLDRSTAIAAYASSLAELSDHFPDDDHVRLLHAAARMRLNGRPFTRVDGLLRPNAELARRTVQTVLSRTPAHPGACVLSAQLFLDVEPMRVLPCVARLRGQLPRVLYLAQLQSSLHIRLGQYAEAISTAEQALERWRRGETGYGGAASLPTALPPVVQALGNAATFAAAMRGQRELALRSARDAARLAMTSPNVSSAHEFSMALPTLTLVTFGDWNAVLRDPLPANTRPFARALVMYARGVAFAAKQRWHDAELALGAVRALTGRGRSSVEHASMQWAAHALSGEIALRRGQPALAAEAFRLAVVVEDEGAGDETAAWYYPVRHSLGLALLAAGRARESAAVYEAALRTHPENGWALLGLAHAFGAQGKRDDARRAHERFAMAFSAADVTVPGSRY